MAYISQVHCPRYMRNFVIVFKHHYRPIICQNSFREHSFQQILSANNGQCNFKGTRCLGSDELVFEKRLCTFVIKCIWLEKF